MLDDQSVPDSSSDGNVQPRRRRRRSIDAILGGPGRLKMVAARCHRPVDEVRATLAQHGFPELARLPITKRARRRYAVADARKARAKQRRLEAAPRRPRHRSESSGEIEGQRLLSVSDLQRMAHEAHRELRPHHQAAARNPRLHIRTAVRAPRARRARRVQRADGDGDGDGSDGEPHRHRHHTAASFDAAFFAPAARRGGGR